MAKDKEFNDAAVARQAFLDVFNSNLTIDNFVPIEYDANGEEKIAYLTPFQKFMRAFSGYINKILGDGGVTFVLCLMNKESIGDKRSAGWYLLSISELKVMSKGTSYPLDESMINMFGITSYGAEELIQYRDTIIGVMPTEKYNEASKRIAMATAERSECVWGEQEREVTKKYKNKPFVTTVEVSHSKEPLAPVVNT